MDIKKHLSEAALLENLAEECVELAHAAQKCARILRGENPTPLTLQIACDMLSEEWADVRLVVSVLPHEKYFSQTDAMMEFKRERWENRLEAAGK